MLELNPGLPKSMYEDMADSCPTFRKLLNCVVGNLFMLEYAMERLILHIFDHVIEDIDRSNVRWSTANIDCTVIDYPDGDGQYMRIAKLLLALRTSGLESETTLFGKLSASNADDIALVEKLIDANGRTLALLKD